MLLSVCVSVTATSKLLLSSAEASLLRTHSTYMDTKTLVILTLYNFHNFATNITVSVNKDI